jgi:broad specificity phosphatase PhoE
LSETVIGLFRHGQTDWNIDLRLQGTADIPMNAFGIAQVERAAVEVARQDWDLIISSPLGRAKETASILSRRLGIEEIIEEKLLLERAFGIGEGMLYDEWSAKFAHLDEIPGAESASEITARAEKLLIDFHSNFEGKKILAVSHGALIRFVLQVVTEGAIPPKGERLENASLNVVRKIEDWTLDQWSPKPLGS